MITLRKAEERGQGSGELAFRYLMDCVTLLLVGPGRFSVGNYVESCIVEGCVAGAFDHPSWLNSTAGSAEDVLRGLPTLYGHFRKYRNVLDFTPDTFEPSRNIFQNKQGILALCRPEKAKELNQQFIDANLPHYLFDKPLKCNPIKKNNPWISGLFYLFATVIIMAGLATIAKVLSVWILPLLILGGLLLLTVIGAFQLRNDNQIEEKNFLALMKLAFKQIPLLGKLLPKKESE